VGLAAVLQQVCRVRPVVANVLKGDVVAGDARAVWLGADVSVPVVANWDKGEASVCAAVTGWRGSSPGCLLILLVSCRLLQLLLRLRLPG
jgi:hypothetical protein